MAERTKVAVASCNENLDWCKEDLRQLKVAFEKRGLEYTPIPWDDPNADWEEYSAVVVRTTVDYFRRPDEFRKWLEERRLKRNIRMWNSPDVILWNMHKGYLKYFAEHGISLEEMIIYEKGTQAPALGDILRQRGWRKAVVKPAISAGSYETFAVDGACAETKQTTFETYLSDRDMIVERYIEEITENGEYSLLYFDKVFSHAVHKYPAPNDFRSSAWLDGVKVGLCEPPKRILETGKRIISLIEADLLYARVDLVEKNNGEIIFMEIELIEPHLHLALKEGAVDTFADTLLKYMQKQ